MYAHFGPEAIDALHTERRARLLQRPGRAGAADDWASQLARGSEL